MQLDPAPAAHHQWRAPVKRSRGSVHVILHHQGTRAQFAQDRTKEIEDCPFVLNLKFFMTAGEVSDCTGAPAMLGHMPKAEWLLADRGYGADWCREALKDRGKRVCNPGRKSRKKKIRFDRRRYKRRNRFEIIFGRLKDWRRIPNRYDRCPKVFLSAIALAATVLFWL